MTVKRHIAITTSSYIGLFVLALWSVFPILFTFVISLRPNLAALVEANPFLFVPRLTNYANVLQQTEFLHYLGNTLLVSVTTAIISIVFGLPAGYALARFDFRGRRFVAQWFLTVRLAPPIAFVVPFFMMFSGLRLLDTSLALILVYTVFLLPFSIWLFSAYIGEIPVQSEEAAMVDGLSRLGALRRVVVPQIVPAIAAVTTLNLVAAWNEFLFALILTSTDGVTLPVAISSFFGERGVFWGRMAAAGVMIMTFPVLISIWLHRAMGKAFSIKGAEHERSI